MSSNQKAAIALGVFLICFGAFMAISGLLSKSVDDREALLMVGALFSVLGLTPILLVIATRRRRNASRHRKPAKVLFGAPANLPGMSRFEFTNQTLLPRICVCCGSPTKDTSTHRIANINTAYQKYDSARMHPASFLFIWKRMMMIALTVFFITRIQHLFRRKAAGSGDVLFHIPHCRHCIAHNTIRAYHADFHTKQMIIHAHPDFVKAAQA